MKTHLSGAIDYRLKIPESIMRGIRCGLSGGQQKTSRKWCQEYGHPRFK
jgi:hypothetical protein